VLLAGLLLMCAGPLLAQPPNPAAGNQPELPKIQSIRIHGASVYTTNELQQRLGLVTGARLPGPPEEIAREIEQRYARDGYTFGRAKVAIDDAGVLAIDIDEGQIDDVEFRGVSAEVAARLREAFAIRTGDVFNRMQATRALEDALALTHGAIERRPGQTFAMDRDQGRHVLQVFLRARGSRSGVFVGTQGREDWYSPVDGVAPALGFQSTIFDTKGFNHSYWAGYISYKFAAERAGYTFGFERPFFAEGVLQLGASLHDITGSDDRWRLTGIEQSLVAFGFRNTFRDYYRRKGFQLHAALHPRRSAAGGPRNQRWPVAVASDRDRKTRVGDPGVRPLGRHEWMVAWRDESQRSLLNETDFGLFRGDHAFRPNLPALEGDLRALLVGYTFDSGGLTEQQPGQRYRRHLLDDLFGSALDGEHRSRIEWRSEFAPAAFAGDFDFSRHIVNARTWLQISPRRVFSGRVLAGFSDGVLPPQRLFALGGIGSVHGYRFKDVAGESMLLLNGELRQSIWRPAIAGLAFIDTGRVGRPLAGSTGNWLTGVGVGVEVGTARVEFGWRADDIPRSLQVLFRLNRSL
jgi:hypothetical protein